MTDANANQVGVDDVLALATCFNEVAQKIADAEVADGKLSTAEIVGAMASSWKEELRAIVGMKHVPEELKDMTDEEKSEVLAAFMPGVLALVKMFMPASK